MQPLKAVIIDDEESARNVLSNLLTRFCPSVLLVGTASNLVDGFKIINDKTPNVVFLDIEMPNYSGFEIVHFIQEINFEIIFVTAYDKYALKAFDVSAVDYLLKPIDIEKLKNSVQKVSKIVETKSFVNHYKILEESLKNNEIKNIVISEKGIKKIISVADIIAIEANEAYSVIYTIEQEFVMSKNLKYFENILDDNKHFLRSHKSWIVNKNYIQKYSLSLMEIYLQKNVIAKLSKYKKQEFDDFMYIHS